nr:unnamed protein product [Digitaria exilis]
MVPESIYDPEFPDTSHFRSGRGCHSALGRIKEEWGTSRWFLEFDIRKCFHTIDRHRFISILKEEIDDSKFFYPTQKLFSAGRLVGGEKGPDSVPNNDRALIVGRVKSIQRKATFHSLVSSTPRRRGDQKMPFVFPPSAALAAFLNKPSSLLCAAFLIEAPKKTQANPRGLFDQRQRQRHSKLVSGHRDKSSVLLQVLR